MEGSIMQAGSEAEEAARKLAWRIPESEPERVQTYQDLKDLGLNRDPEERFDSVVNLCCSIFQVPMAFVSLIDGELCWFKASCGIPHGGQISRKNSLCAWTLLPTYPEMLVVEDALRDPRFALSPIVVGPPGIRFYAGAPLVASNNVRLGTLCILDTRDARRTFDVASAALLANLAEVVTREIEKDKVIIISGKRQRELSAQNARLYARMQAAGEGLLLLDVEKPGWPVRYVNEAASKTTCMPRDLLEGAAFWDLFSLEDHAPGNNGSSACQCGGGTGSSSDSTTCAAAADARQAAEAAAAASQPFSLRACCSSPSGTNIWLDINFTPGMQSNAARFMPLVAIPSNVVDSSSFSNGNASSSCEYNAADYSSSSAISSGSRMAAAGIYYFATLEAPSLVRNRPAAAAATTAAPAAGSAASSGPPTPAPSAALPPATLRLEPSTDTFSSLSLGESINTRSPSTSEALIIVSGDLPDSTSAETLDTVTVGPNGAGGGAAKPPASNKPAAPLIAGVKLGALLGRGRLGCVYRGTWHGTRVAVKVMQHPLPPADGDVVKGGSDCTNLLQRGGLQVAHPSVAVVYESASRTGASSSPDNGGGGDGQQAMIADTAGKSAAPPPLHHMAETWMVMELCGKGNLREAIDKGWLRRPHGDAGAAGGAAAGAAANNGGGSSLMMLGIGEPDYEAILATAREVAGAMAHLHQRGAVHGALHGRNVLLAAAERSPEDSRGWVAKLADAGLHALLMSAEERASAARRPDAVRHMAPELLKQAPDGAAAEPTTASDVYAFGIVLWEMVTGQQPFAGLHADTVAQRIIASRGPPLQLPSSCPQPLRQLVQACCGREPSGRPTFQQALSMLSQAEGELDSYF